MTEIVDFKPPRPLKTSVLFLVFNRLDTTVEVFEEIRKAKPPKLYIASDGARPDKEGESENVKTVREYILNNVDWVCEVKTLFRKQNLGCKYAVSSAIDWFFKNEEQGIILEDDCVPSQSFFWFCEELLKKYKDDNSIYMISGDSRGSESFDMKEDYGFCKYPMVWGWASWSRVWNNYDVEISDYPNHKHNVLKSISSFDKTVRFWEKAFDKVFKKQIDTWDYQFSYLFLKNKAKCIVPNVNLITNIGFRQDATHTFNKNSVAANRIRKNINFPLKHETSLQSEIMINKYYDVNEFSNTSFIQRLINKFSNLF